MGLGTGLARIILFICTVCFFILGVAFLAGGILILVNQSQLFNVLNLIFNSQEAEAEIENIATQKGLVQTAGIVMIAVGVFTAIVSFFGCFGAVKESKCLLTVFAVLITLILAAQVAAGVIVVYYRSSIQDQITRGLYQIQDKYLVSLNDAVSKEKQPQNSVTLALNYLYVFADCCGANRTLDAAMSSAWLASNRTWMVSGAEIRVPVACCKLNNKDDVLVRARWNQIQQNLQDPTCPVTGIGAHEKLCVQSLLDFIGSYMLWVVIGCSVFAVSQILVIVFTGCLICAID